MRTLFRLCALVVMLFLLVGVTWAQDEATPSPEADGSIIVEPADATYADVIITEFPIDVVTETPPVEPVDSESPPTADTGNTIIYLVIALVGIVTGFGVGTASGIAGALAFIKRLNANDNIKLAIEKLAMSLPGNTLQDVRSLIELARQGVNFADEVTDGKLENGESITLSKHKFIETPDNPTAPDVYRE
jgi:hypothetical protein